MAQQDKPRGSWRRLTGRWGREGEWDRMKGLRNPDGSGDPEGKHIRNWEKWQQTQKEIYRRTKRRQGQPGKGPEKMV
jgi:hypothetical protein